MNSKRKRIHKAISTDPVIVGFHGSSVGELETGFHESVDSYIDISIRSRLPVHSFRFFQRTYVILTQGNSC